MTQNGFMQNANCYKFISSKSLPKSHEWFPFILKKIEIGATSRATFVGAQEHLHFIPISHILRLQGLEAVEPLKVLSIFLWT